MVLISNYRPCQFKTTLINSVAGSISFQVVNLFLPKYYDKVRRSNLVAALRRYCAFFPIIHSFLSIKSSQTGERSGERVEESIKYLLNKFNVEASGSKEQNIKT